MESEKKFEVVSVAKLSWPQGLEVRSRKFRMFVAADTTDLETKAISDFAREALNRGMVYLCAWGPGCERFHDIVDEVVIEDDLNERKFAGPSLTDAIMTTWHSNESLAEAIDFFATCAMPTDGFAPDSDFRLLVCVGNIRWTTEAEKYLHSARFLI